MRENYEIGFIFSLIIDHSIRFQLINQQPVFMPKLLECKALIECRGQTRTIWPEICIMRP